MTELQLLHHAKTKIQKDLRDLERTSLREVHRLLRRLRRGRKAVQRELARIARRRARVLAIPRRVAPRL